MTKLVIYKKDFKQIIYRAYKIQENRFLLKGVSIRKEMIVNEEDIEEAKKEDVESDLKEAEKYNYIAKAKNRSKKYLLGTVLHIDSDKEYLEKNIKFYKEMGIYCVPVFSKENNLVENIININLGIIPDVVVITGHDVLQSENIKDINSYKNSKYFVGAVKYIRKKYPNSVIIAGACQSHFDALIANGANFASSPKRVNVHIYDPAVIAVNVCVTSLKDVVDFNKMRKYIDNIGDAFGGVETYGKMRMLY